MLVVSFTKAFYYYFISYLKKKKKNCYYKKIKKEIRGMMSFPLKSKHKTQPCPPHQYFASPISQKVIKGLRDYLRYKEREGKWKSEWSRGGKGEGDSENRKVLRQFGGAILGKGGRRLDSKKKFRNTHNEGHLTVRFCLSD